VVSRGDGEVPHFRLNDDDLEAYSPEEAELCRDLGAARMRDVRVYVQQEGWRADGKSRWSATAVCRRRRGFLHLRHQHFVAHTDGHETDDKARCAALELLFVLSGLRTKMTAEIMADLERSLALPQLPPAGPSELDALAKATKRPARKARAT
jgi:hypothetical protein